MSISVDSPRHGVIAIASAIAFAACAAGKPAPVIAPVAAASGTPNRQPESKPVALPDSPTASRIVIARDVLDACHIADGDGDAYFAFDSSRLTSNDLPPLTAVAQCFASGPLTGRKVQLVGHADPRGTDEYNMTLGQSRADVVALYLTAHGVSPVNATSTSRGELDAKGVDESGWARDRRVDVMLGK